MDIIEYRIMHDMEQSYWWFVGKHFLVKTILETLSFNSARHDKILDIGCGTGSTLQLLEKFGSAYGMELSWEAIRFLRKRGLSLITQSDANRCLPFKNSTFSAITCLDVLEHLENDFNLLKEMMRVCKPGGHVIVTVPAFEILWSPHDVALHHNRRYTRKQMAKKVRKLNCNVIRSSYYNTALFLPILAVRKLKTLSANKQSIHSDFFMHIPRWLNNLLTLLFVSEIRLLRFANFPFGVSLLLILQKDSGNSNGNK